ncbi:MAG: hypothetical protein O4861_10395 [Trichodesmium sp. St16_bin4-tuft]|nr:hypothetical protein [Trichodesmium sp. St4_bin8_1]MDE5070336.1 hypothetical protein [Trichodesmium sp. St5_bin8]MDE5079819.1 hypothetical protein [Trichodesmium sp. St2_bin6]MDE5098716.1 hypothetical protein [Trichodesmium sp. St16_bin4-tuft]MDE5102015.1 hypothetical protein [Trichodesmium sp. St19_bin2]
MTRNYFTLSFSKSLVNQVLADFAEHFGLDKYKEVILICDRAG